MKMTIINAITDLGVAVDGSNPTNISKYFINDTRIDNIYTINKPNIIKDKSSNNKEKNIEAVNSFNEELYKTILNIKDNLVITLGGDHSMAIASALASIKKENSLGILWLDSHGDYNTFATTVTGNLHGLPLAAIDNAMERKLSMFHDGNYYNSNNTIIIGGRDIDSWEMPNIINNNVTLYTTEDMHNNIPKIVEEAIKKASNNTSGIHISYDLDLIDPQVAPGVSVPAINGISEEEAYLLIDEILKYKDLIKSFDLVEYNPLFDQNNKTLNIAVNIINKILDAYK